MRILGIDPGTATTGWAIIETENNRITPIAYGHIQTSSKKTEEERILEISRDLEKIIKKYAPAEAAIEQIFFFKNKKTVIGVAQARGAIALTLKKKCIRISGYTPLQVKQALTSYGRATKTQIQLMTQKLLKLSSIPKPDDTADALAIAVCHAHSRKFKF